MNNSAVLRLVVYVFKSSLVEREKEQRFGGT
jgi:hypothetical protein